MWARILSSSGKAVLPIRHLLRRSSQTAPAKTLTDSETFKIGEQLHGFEVKQVQDIKEFKVTAIFLIHNKTKAEYLHLYRNDSNNVFSVNFRTTPLNSTGLPHILEHTVLCGSQLYPVRDPFFKMLNRSLATFMNALTGPDYTMYPFSTQNPTDFRNLQRIYLDATFRPQLKLTDFMQEGWRLENVKPDDINSDLVIKGVVYNEMKGVFSDNDNILQEKLQNLLLPDHTYGVVSGGDPMKIPDLTWEDLKEFHKKFYHPSNTKFFSYGNIPLAPTLELINGEYLKDYEYKQPSDTVVPRQIRWPGPKTNEIACYFNKMGETIDKQNMITISLLLSDITNIYETFLMQFLCELLVKGPNSPFYKKLIETNISNGFTLNTGYNPQTRDTIFTIGLQGIKESNFEKFQQLYKETLNDVIQNGFDKDHINSVLHQCELSIKHESSNFGLNLLFHLMPLWNHQGDIIDYLQINKLIDGLKKQLEIDPRYLQKSIKANFLDNTHSLLLIMKADKDYDKKQMALEKSLIKSKTKGLNEKDKALIFDNNQKLAKEQGLNDNINLLPTLTIDDIKEDLEKIPKDKMILNSVETQLNYVNTNGIIYFKSLLSTIELTQEQQMLLPLFSYVITKLGTNKINYKDFDNLINSKTNGLCVKPYISESLFNLHTYESCLLIDSYCLEKNLDDMFNIWSEIFALDKLEQDKLIGYFEILVKLFMANLVNGIIDNGHLYAMSSSSSLVSATSYKRELLNGLQHITYMKRLIKTANYKAMLDEILNIAKIVFNKRNIRCAINLDPEYQKRTLKSYEHFLNNLPSNPTSYETTYVEGKIWASKDAVNCQHHVLNIPVNYCSKSILTVPYTTRDYANLRVLARLLTSKYLHPEVREKNGAYGSGVKLTLDGVFAFYSYRDPNNLKTLDIFDNSYKWLQNALSTTITEQDILEAKLGVFQSVDAPIAPSNRGNEDFFNRLTNDMLQRHRADVMSTSLKQLQNVNDKYLGNFNMALNGKVVIGAKSQGFNTTKRTNELWTIVDDE